MKIQLCHSANPSILPHLLQNGEWIFQKKLDGARCVAINGRLFNRGRPPNDDETNRDITDLFPEIQPPAGWVLDGELMGRDVGDVVGRQLLQNCFETEIRAKTSPCRYVAFDVLEVNGEDVRQRPLIERLRLLEKIPKCKGVEVLPYTEDGEALWKEVVAGKEEGIIAKRKTSLYITGRSWDWLKIKNHKEEIFPILRWEDTANGGFVIFVGLPNGNEQKVVVNGIADQIKIKESKVPLKAEIQFLQWSKHGKLRQPTFKNLILEDICVGFFRVFQFVRKCIRI